eukprot:751858-Hanusia_phi.AAC.1
MLILPAASFLLPSSLTVSSPPHEGGAGAAAVNLRSELLLRFQSDFARRSESFRGGVISRYLMFISYVRKATPNSLHLPAPTSNETREAGRREEEAAGKTRRRLRRCQACASMTLAISCGVLAYGSLSPARTLILVL